MVENISEEIKTYLINISEQRLMWIAWSSLLAFLVANFVWLPFDAELTMVKYKTEPKP